MSSETVTDLLARLKHNRNILLGSKQSTDAMIHAHMEQFRTKVNEINSSVTLSINNLKLYLSQMSLAQPEEFKLQFSSEKMLKGFQTLSDGSVAVTRTNQNGSNFMPCLSASPFSPVANKVSFRINHVAEGNKSIALGACVEQIVKNNSYLNCAGFGKGVYAIDQNCGYNNNGEKMLSSWNHHDTQFNQAHVGSNDLVVKQRIFRAGPLKKEIPSLSK